MSHSKHRLAVTTLVVVSSALGCQTDVVGPGYDYEEPPIEVPGASSGGASSGGAPASAGGTEPAGSGGAPATNAGGVPAAAGGVPAASGAPSTAGGAPPQPPAGARCDLTGRWVITQRMAVEALGVRQAVRTWFYYQLAQSGDAVTVSKGLHCGYDVVPMVALGANVDLRKAWPRIMADNPHDGRKGTSRASGAGCALTFGKLYSIDGATASAYRDGVQPLPLPEQQAGTGGPGWEDYDGDGKPGSTYTITGLVNGAIHVASRTLSDWSGTVPDTAKSFLISSHGGMEEALLGYDGSPLLASTFVKTNDPALHIVEFARLGDSQATDDDAAVCAAVRTLANTLTPKGNEKPI